MAFTDLHEGILELFEEAARPGAYDNEFHRGFHRVFRVSEFRVGENPNSLTVLRKNAFSKGHRHSEETRKKMSKAKKGRPASETSLANLAKGRGPKSKETRAKISAANVGRKLSEESRAKMRASARKKTKLPAC